VLCWRETSLAMQHTVSIDKVVMVSESEQCDGML